MTSRVRRALLLPVLALVLAACQLQVDVNVTVAKDGSGTVEAVVTLDDAAVANVGGDLSKALALDGLRAEGWTIEGPTRQADGHTVVRVRHRFAEPAGAATVFAQLSGKGGPFQGFAVTRRASLTRTTGGRSPVGWTSSAAPEPGAPPATRTWPSCPTGSGTSLQRIVQVRVRVLLPGQVTSNATTKATNGASWQLAFGGQPLHLQAHGTERHATPYVLAGLGLRCWSLGAARLRARCAWPRRSTCRRRTRDLRR